jgi:hypothetical protein
VIPQANFMVWADVTDEAELRRLLTSMNNEPGVVDPKNALVPFGRFDRLHFARFVILDDQTLGDIETAYKLKPVLYPLSLGFLVDFDGDTESFLDELVRVAGDGLRQIFACAGLGTNDDLLDWMKAHSVVSSASYVNWVGRSMQQVREEVALRDFLCTYLRGAGAASVKAQPAAVVRKTLRAEVQREQAAGRIKLTPIPRTPFGWWLADKLDFLRGILILIAIFVFGLLLLPVTIGVLALYVIMLRIREKTDPEITPRPAEAWRDKLAEIEDHDVTNQFSAMGSLKPGAFRRLNIRIGLAAVKWGARHLYTRGRLARVSSIHFARWVFINGGNRLYFSSNYDGSLESYMDDFINKVGFGLNLVFSNGIGYPRTNYLVCDGAHDEQKFKRYIRRHELPTEVWYNAHPGLTAVDLARNTRIRQGLERRSMTAAETCAWLALF